MKYTEYINKTIENQDNWIEKTWSNWNNFYNDVKIGDYIIVPIECIVPRSEIEFDNAISGASKSNGEIEITMNLSGCSELSRKATFVVFDGHNRLKTMIENGTKRVKCLVK